MRLRHVFAILTLSLWTATASAAPPQATCRDYSGAQGAEQALFFGFIYGYAAAKLEGHSDDEINAATLRLVAVVGRYCLKQPDDRLLSAVAKLADVATNDQTK